MKVLILEDEPLLQIDLADTVADMGHDVMGPFGAEAPAMDACTLTLPDAAIVDFNLGPQKDSRQLASLLMRKGVRFAFITAHSRRHLPDAFVEIPVIEKPYSQTEISAFLSGER